ncbi:phytanoyl-CoA dioxygenase family protein [Chitinimonas lacunae]|uniref:Phytanoyl-CoA dioxygenase family protein n=1 Tax=Chitinimonas lacunae TaxID=1963018 RepID=A0ABV8MLH7_9NEIS
MTPDGLSEGGYQLLPGQLDAEQCDYLKTVLSRIPPERAGRRNILESCPEIWPLVEAGNLYAPVRARLGPQARLVRALYFDKTAARNWQVGWHQDLSIAVSEAAELPGFSAWSSKAGVVHVQPPDALLARMLTVRLHLDPADRDNGALWVLPGSHRQGRLAEEGIDAATALGEPVLIAAAAGDVLLMRPLLLHASRKALTAARRRVLHLEYSADELPAPLRWALQIEK